MSNRFPKTKLPAWALEYLGRFRAHAAVALGLGLLASGCAVLLMYTSGYLISRTAQDGVTLFMVMVPVALVQLFGLGRPIARYFERLVSHDWVFRVTSRLRYTLFGAVGRTAGDPASARPVGAYLGLLTDDIGHLQNLYLRVAFPTVIALLLWVAATLFCGFVSAGLAAVMLVVGALSALALPLLALRITRQMAIQAKDGRHDEYAQLTDDLIGGIDWTLAGRSDQAIARHVDACGDLDRLEQTARHRQRLVELASALVLAAGACCMLVVAGMSFGGAGDSANLIAAFTLGFFPLMEAFALLPAAFAGVTNHRQAISRLDEVIGGSGKNDANAPGSQPDFMDDGAPVACATEEALAIASATTSSDALEATSAVTLPTAPETAPENVTLRLLDVTYRYPHAVHAAIQDMTLSVPAGQRLAILGPSGSGKSTLAALMRGAISPLEGTVEALVPVGCMSKGALTNKAAETAVPRSDDTDATAYSREVAGVTMSLRGAAEAPISLHDAVSYIPQTPYLFDRTLRENLAMANPDASDDDLAAALRKTGLAQKLDALENGLDTHIGETGVGFSGGESHRVALARALVANTPVVVLDEPFASLDPATERALLDTLFQAFDGKTLVVITHHLMGIELFDRVVFVENGRIALDGNPTVLAQTSARFQQLLSFDRPLL